MLYIQIVESNSPQLRYLYGKNNILKFTLNRSNFKKAKLKKTTEYLKVYMMPKLLLVVDKDRHWENLKMFMRETKVNNKYIYIKVKQRLA